MDEERGGTLSKEDDIVDCVDDEIVPTLSLAKYIDSTEELLNESFNSSRLANVLFDNEFEEKLPELDRCSKKSFIS
ncbi:hypothetical protein QR98_0066980 [Sarcoptes scabiei]|uniref:Uncharacterized protein n=1 Tax=Sarcoptes scabiei TaxID=52283 RepID=A0A132AB31_SARSC|nr:hypothetical protein QR98_0066980 [Sarcoptes scabiei]